MPWEPHWSVLNILHFLVPSHVINLGGTTEHALGTRHFCARAFLLDWASVSQNLVSDSGCFVCSLHPVTSSVLCTSRHVGAGGNVPTC